MNTNMEEFMQLTVRQQEIIDAALALIAEQGIQNLTIKNIAAALKITEPAIYRHFDSKFAILDALLDSFDHGSVSVLGGFRGESAFSAGAYRGFRAGPLPASERASLFVESDVFRGTFPVR